MKERVYELILTTTESIAGMTILLLYQVLLLLGYELRK